MIQLTTALQPFSDIPNSQPHAAKATICWNVLQQICHLLLQRRALRLKDVLFRLRDVLKPALCSDDFMPSADGRCMVKVPYFAQIPAVFDMGRRSSGRVSGVAECITESDESPSESSAARRRILPCPGPRLTPCAPRSPRACACWPASTAA
jgi:hypothetical protein